MAIDADRRPDCRVIERFWQWRLRMGSDERAIREVHTTWIDAVNAGDLVRLLTLMADDVVFLNPGQAPLGRDAFPAGFSAAHRRRRNDAGRSPDHHIPQTARRPLASGPRRQHADPGNKLKMLYASIRHGQR